VDHLGENPCNRIDIPKISSKIVDHLGKEPLQYVIIKNPKNIDIEK
jgi:hypothetical protein